MKTKWKKLTLWMMPVVLIVGVVLLVLALILTRRSESDLGEKAVKYLYNFQTPYELDDNMNALRAITTKSVYDQLTIDRTDRVLSVYLKFEGKPVSVILERVTQDYVIYSLKTDSISSYRKFVFYYDINKDGKISYVREGELVDFDNNVNIGGVENSP